MRSWSLSQAPLSRRKKMEPYLWQKVQGWLLHQSTFLSIIIGSGRTLERNLWFGGSSQKIIRQTFSPKVYKVICLSGWGIFYAVGKTSVERIVARNEIFSIKWIIYCPKRDILEYWEMIIFFFAILLYPIKG